MPSVRSAKARRLSAPGGHRLLRGVHPSGKIRVARQLLRGLALKDAEPHLPQILQLDSAHAGEQDLRRLLGAQQRRDEHHRRRRVGELRLQCLQIGAAFGAQRHIAAAADIASFEVPFRQTVPDDVQFCVVQGSASPFWAQKLLQFGYKNTSFGVLGKFWVLYLRTPRPADHNP